MATTYTGLRVQDTYNAIIKIGDNSNLSGTAKLLSDGFGNDSPLYLSGTRLGIGISPAYQFHTSGNAKIGGNLIISGDLTVNGTTTIIDSTIIAIGDNMIEMAKDNVANTKDIGWYGTIVESGTKYAGMAYDASTGVTAPKFNLGLGTVEPGNTFATTITGTLIANLEGNVTGTVSSLSNHDTNDLVEGSVNQYFTTTRARASFTAGTGVTITSGEIAIGQDVATDSNVTFGNITGSAISGTTATFSDDVSIAVSKKLKFGGGNHTYINEDIDDRLRFFVGGSEFMRFTEDTADTINFYKNSTFSGTISASNLSGTNTGDQTLPTDFVSKANGGAFGGGITINSDSFNLNGTAPTMTVNSSNNASGFRISVTGLDDVGDALIRFQDSGTTRFQMTKDGRITTLGNIDTTLVVDTNTNNQPLNITRLGSTSSQTLQIGITDTVAMFNYIEDTSSEGNGNFGTYSFRLGGNDGETTVIPLVLGKTTSTFGGDVTAENIYLNTIAYKGGEGTKLDNSAFNVDGIGTNFRWIESNSGSTGSTWKKVADVVITNAITPNGVQLEAKVYQPNTNSGVTAGLHTIYYSVAFRGRIDDSSTHNDAIVYGKDANLLRVYKTADYTFELQARSNDDNRDLVVECNITSKKGGKVTPTTTYTDGTITGGTAYTATANNSNKTKFAGDVEFEGAVFDDAEVEDLRVNEFLYLGSGATSGYGPHIQHSDSGGTGKGMRITVDSDLQVWGVTGNAGEQNQGLYVAGGVAKLYDSNGVVLETVLGGVDITGTLEVSGTITGDVTGDLTGAASLNVLKAGDTMTGNLKLNDDVLFLAGTSDDLKIYHNSTSSNTNIENHTGSLYITNYSDDEDIVFRNDNGSGDVVEYFRLDGSTNTVPFGRSPHLPDGLRLYFGSSTADDGSIRWDSTASQLFIDGTAKFLDSLFVVGNQNIGNTSIEADRILKIQTAAEYNTEVQLRESTDNYGFTMRYDGTANKFKIIRHDNSAAGVDIITIGRGANTVAFAGGITTQAISTFGGGITMGGQQINMVNGNIVNINNLTFNDAGGNEGINWNGGNLWRIFESPNDLSNASGNLQFVKDTTRSMTLDTSGNLFVLGALTSTGHINNGSLTINSDDGITIRTTTNGVGAKIKFSDDIITPFQEGTLYFAHTDNTSIGSGAAFHFDTTESQVSVVSGDATSEGNFLSYSRASTAEVDYGFVADLNTGMYRPANHQLGFVVNGSRKIQLTSAGVFVQNGDLNVSSGNIDVAGNIGAEKVTIATPSVANGGTLGADVLSLTGTSETTSTSGTVTPTNAIVFKPAMPAGYGTDGYNTVLEQQSGGARTFYFRTSGASHLSIDVEHGGIFGGYVATGAGTQSINSDAPLTIRTGNSFAGFDLHSARTSGNIGGARWYSTTSSTVPEAQLLVETDGLLRFYNGTNGAENRFTILSNGQVGIGEGTPADKLDVNGAILSNNRVQIDGVDDAGNVTGSEDSLRVTGYGIMGNRTGNIYITNGNTAAGAAIVFGVRGAHNGNNKLVINDGSATFYANAVASNHYVKALGTTENKVISEYDSTHFAQLESNSSGGVVKGIGGGGFLARSYGDTYFNGGNLGVGIAVPTNNDFGSVAPRLHVLGAGANGEFRLTARFQAGADADNTGAAILINHSNDRGLLIEAGRESSDRGIAHFGIVNSGGTNVRILSLKQHSGTDYRFGVNVPSPYVDFDFQKYNATNGSASTMRVGGVGSNESSKLELAETLNGSGVMTYGFSLQNRGNLDNKFRIHSHNNSVDGNNSFEIDRVTGNVGIKGASGSESLQVNGNIFLTNNSYIAFDTSASSGHPKIAMNSSGTFTFQNTANLVGLQVNNSGSIVLNNGTGQAVLVKGGTMNFGVPGNGGNVNGRFCTIEGNTDASGEGSGRIFFAEHNSTTASKEAYGMSLGYRGGGTVLPSGFSGLTQIGNGEWGMWGHNASQNGTLIMSGTRSGSVLKLQTTHVEMKAVSQRVKFSVWTGTTYGYGMQSGYTYGALDNEYALTSQMSNTDGRGWWWGDNGHTNAQGAMSLNTRGRLTVATSVRLGYGEGDTTNVPSYALDVSGSIRATSDVIAFSDRRVKENIVTIDNALEKVTKLRGVNYTRKDIDDKSTKIGVIAQEVLKVLPEVVSIDDEDKHSVAYGNMAGVFIEAIKELKAEVDSLKQEIKQLKK